MKTNGEYAELEALARRGRWLAISTVAYSGAGHVGGPFSAMDLMIALYFRVMKIDPQNPGWPERDRFILSKGHSSIGQYSAMALRGFLPLEELKTFDKGNSRLQGHPDVTKLPGLDTSTGSLGQGLSVGLGMALGARLRGEKFHTFVMLGDGELQEGMVWEALHIAPRYKLGNLTAIDPIRMSAAQTHANIKIGAAYSGILTGLTGKTHQDVQDLAIMRAMPEMIVIAPVDSVECEAAIRWATDHNGPVYLRLARDVCPDVFDPGYEFVLGRTIQLKEGKDVLLVSTGPQSYRCKEAADLLAKDGISAGVLHVPSIKPINADELGKACEKSDVVVTVEEHSIYGGLGGLVAEILSERSPRKVFRVGIEDRWGESAPNDFLLDLFRLSPPRLSERIKELLRDAS